MLHEMENLDGGIHGSALWKEKLDATTAPAVRDPTILKWTPVIFNIFSSLKLVPIILSRYDNPQ